MSAGSEAKATVPGPDTVVNVSGGYGCPLGSEGQLPSLSPKK